MVHDGNRPFVSEEMISDSIATYKRYGSAVAAMPCIEAIFRSEKDLIRLYTKRTAFPYADSSYIYIGKIIVGT